MSAKREERSPPASPATTAPEPSVSREAEFSFPLAIRDFQGDERWGSVAVARQWHPALAEMAQEDFRLVILGEPPSQSVALRKAVAVCAPMRPLASLRRIKEAGVAYTVAGEAALPLGREDMEALAQGRLLAPVELEVRPRDIFPPRGEKARLDLLAQDLLLQLANSPYLAAARLALAAPSEPPAATTAGETQKQLNALLATATAALPKQAKEPTEIGQAIHRLTSLAQASSLAERVEATQRLYPKPGKLAEDIYALRALAKRPAEALELTAMRRYLGQAVVPESETNLALDRTIAGEQMTYALLVTEPHRFSSVWAVFQHFRSHYQRAYLEHQQRYWAEAARIHARLLEARTEVAALGRLNTLTELGPPVGEGALALYSDLLEQTSGCPQEEHLGETLKDNPVCPGCGLRLDSEPPRQQGEDVLNRLRRAIGRQMTRLSAAAVQQVLARSGDPRVERFLKVVQASQISSLAEVLDDELLGFLRRFLVEARIDSMLRPLLDRLQQAPPPPADQAVDKVTQEVSRVLQRAFRVARRQLPPGQPKDGE